MKLLISVKVFSAVVCLITAIGQSCFAQQVHSLPNTRYDSLVMIKKTLFNSVTKQLKKKGMSNEAAVQGLVKLLHDSTAVDSIGNVVIAKMDMMKKNLIQSGTVVTKDFESNTVNLLQQSFSNLLQIKKMKAFISAFKGFTKKEIVQWQGMSVNTKGQLNPSLDGQGSTISNTSVLSSSSLVMGIPLGFQFMRQDVAGPGTYSRNLFSFQFDREAYLKSMKEKLKLNRNVAGLLPREKLLLEKMKELAITRLKSTIDSFSMADKRMLAALTKDGSIESLLQLDQAVLKDKIQNYQLSLREDTLYTGTQQALNIVAEDTVVNDFSIKTTSVAVIGKVLKITSSFRESLAKSGLTEKWKQYATAEDLPVNKLLQDPGKLTSMAKEQLNLTGIEKIFLNINQLSVGMRSVNLSPLSVYQYTHSGFCMSFSHNNNYLFIMAGKQAGLQGLFSTGVQTILPASNNTVMGVRIGKGNITDSYTHISLFNYKQNGTGSNTNMISGLPGNTVVATFSKQLVLSENGFLSLELSKSAHTFSNQEKLYDSLQRNAGTFNQTSVNDNFLQQMAFAVQWNGENREKQLSYDLHLRSTGNAYSNPGNLFLTNSSKELGGSIRKVFLQNHLQIISKLNYREYSSGVETQWRNYQFFFQAKWKLKKGQYIMVRYQPFESVRVQGDKNYTIASTNILSVEGSLHKRFNEVNYQHTLTFSAEKNNYLIDTFHSAGNAVIINSTQLFMINRNSYYLNTNYNKSLTGSINGLAKTWLNMEAGCTYNIAKNITGSTALNYNSTQGWFRQIGVKQTLNARIGDQFSVGTYIDFTKNIKQYRPYNIGNTWMNWNLQYTLK